MYTFTIFSIYEDEFNKRLDAVNRRAAKSGLDEFTAVISNSRDDDGRAISIIELDCDLPQFNGWSLTAIIDFVTSGEISESLSRILPGRQMPSGFSDVDAKKCDHCGIRHSRTQVYVIEHEDGEIMQIGGNCMELFLGSGAASIISNSWLIDFEDECNERGFWGTPKTPLDLDVYLWMVKLTISAYGWVSRGRAHDEMIEATADTAYDMSDNEKRAEAIVLAGANPHTKTYKTDDAIAWATSQSGNDYLDNIASIARLEIVPRKFDGYAASILAAYERHLEQEAEAALQRETATPASPGRQVVTGTIISIKEKFGQYGVQLKMVLLTADGWKLYSTLPRAIATANSGDQVAMTVTVTPSDNDAFFAFGSRPSKATIVK